MLRVPMAILVSCCLAMLTVTPRTSAENVVIDFEGVNSVAELVAAGWTFTGSASLEANITHSGNHALRLGELSEAFFSIGGRFGTLELWAFDYGRQVQDTVHSAGGGAMSVYGPRFGFRKFDGQGGSGGIGAGLCARATIDSTDTYGYELGYESSYGLWWGGETWYSPVALGYLQPGRPPVYDPATGTGGGWNHWRIAYLVPGVVDICLLENWAGWSKYDSIEGAGLFDGSVTTGLDDIFLHGGKTTYAELEDEEDQSFGDGIYDDIVWIPVLPISGDADGDGDVDLDDFVILKLNFGTGDEWAEGDFDGDGDVDLDDFVILKNNFGTTSAP